MLNILDKYIGKTIFTATMMALFILISLSSIIKFVDQLKKVGQGNYNTMGAGVYVLLSVPKDVQIFFPMAFLLGTLVGLGILAQHNELAVMQASGFTRVRIIFSVMKTAIPLIFMTMILDEWISPQGEQIARNYRAQAMYGSSLLSSYHGLWAKDGNNFIYVEHVKRNNELNGVSIYIFEHNHHLKSIRYAVSAKFDANKNLWNLSQVDESNLSNLDKVNSFQMVSDTWKSNLTPDKLGIVALSPDSLSIYGLYNYVQYLKSSGQDSRSYQLNMWSKIFYPVSVVVMILMALSFVFGPLCNVQMRLRVITGTSFGFAFYVINQIIRPLTLVCGISPIISSLLPSIGFLLISLWMLLKY